MAAPLLWPLRAAARYALPPRCPGCGTVVDADHSFCLACWSALDFLDGPSCATCGAPIGGVVDEQSRCAPCLADPPPFDHAAAAVAYGAIAARIAIRLKHGRRPGLAITVARAMARRAPAGEDWLIAPVPLHRRRIWTRGYNQAALIARALAPLTGGRLALGLIERRRPTPLLRGLGPKARAQTVRGVFALGRGAVVKRRRVLLIDDVYTTGATTRACAGLLKRAGAAEVRVLCWARVVPEDGDGR